MDEWVKELLIRCLEEEGSNLIPDDKMIERVRHVIIVEMTNLILKGK